ncbi:hypothetical protein OE88DRAFT_481964 [Heliocybe sulcata]|uniref:Uncharacterized protein n=1 Tax=Heliocybe sulcata TaxID=5364 RepID=A0A5C3MUK2_9AGAM|nr:hypothetical protein OE88DRAFT_481964 [Heliocybe sulcata]
MSTLSWNQENLLLVLVTTFFYGLYTVVFWTSMYVLVRRPVSNLRHILPLVTVLLYILSTAQMALTFWQGFVSTDIQDGPSGEISPYLLLHEVNLNNLGGCISYSLMVLSNAIADGLLIWRCLVIWGSRRSVVAVPVMLLLVETACGCALAAFTVDIYRLRLHTPPSEITPPPKFIQLSGQKQKFEIVFFLSSFVTNLLMSSLIAFKIWRESSYITKMRSKRYLRIASLFLETGIFYSICLFLCAIFRLIGGSGDFAWGVTYSIASQIVGIFPTVIVLLASNGWTSERTLTMPQPTAANLGKLEAGASSIHFAAFAEASHGPDSERIVLEVTHPLVDSSETLARVDHA